MKKPLHILFLEDVEADAVLVRHELETGRLDFSLCRVETREAFLREISEHPPDVILSDHGLPSFDGFAALVLAKEKCPNTPFIFVAESLGRDSAIHALKNGATDYVPKSQISRQLIPVVERALQAATERSQSQEAEQALRESEERYHRMVELSPDVVLVHSEHRIVFINQAGVKMLGARSAEELVGRPINEFVHPDSWKLANERVERLYRSEAITAFIEQKWVRVDGQPIDVEVGATSMTFQNKPAAQVIARDITERKRVEKEFQRHIRQQSVVAELGQRALVGVNLPTLLGQAATLLAQTLEIELCEVLELLPEGRTFILRAGVGWKEGNVGRTTMSAEEQFQEGYTLRSTEPVVSEDLSAEGRFAVAPLMRAHGARSGVSAIIHAPGRPFGILGVFSIRKRRFNSHEVLFVQAIANVLGDALERQHAEREIQINEERFRLLIDGVHDYAIYMLDAQGNVMSWNKGAERIEGYRADEIVGKNHAIFFPPDEVSQRRAEEVLQIALTTGRFQEDVRQVRKDRTLYWANLLYTALHDESGRLCGIAKVAHDMTIYKEAQNEIQRLNATLEHRVRERTAQLEDANRELEAFSYSVSHDLRAPLRHIDGFVDMLRQRIAVQLDETGREYLTIITDSTHQMGRLIDALLAFSRTGRAALTKTQINFNALIQSVLHDLSFEVEGRRIDWAIADLPPVQGDASLLRQVWVNLISNALKYTRRRERARIEIGFRNEESEFVFYIRDNGIGFDMEFADRLFGVFQRLHGAAEFEGTGIGLANVRRIIQRHGGRVWAEAVEDAGATFYFTLPKSGERPEARV